MLDAAAIETEANYGVTTANYYIQICDEYRIDVVGSRILEIGPGRNLAAPLVLASQGADVTLADRFLCEWDDDYHPAVYRKFLSIWPKPAPMVEQALSTREHPVRMLREPAEQMPGLADGEFDMVLSNAVLEHVYDLDAVARELFRVTTPGGLQRHQIDFRDHADFTRPLEFLLRDDAEHAAGYMETYWHTGNRVRPSEARDIFRRAGFEIIDMRPNCMVPDDYLPDFLPRLRACGTRYRDWPADDLGVVGAEFFLRRPRSPAS
jgi:hypothetical protein